MERGSSLVAGAIVGYLLHKQVDWALISLYNKHPTASRFIIGISLGMGVYFLTQEMPRLITKLSG